MFPLLIRLVPQEKVALFFNEMVKFLVNECLNLMSLLKSSVKKHQAVNLPDGLLLELKIYERLQIGCPDLVNCKNSKYAYYNFHINRRFYEKIPVK